MSLEYGAGFLGSQVGFKRAFAQQFGYLPLGAGVLFASGARYDWSSGGGQTFLSTQRLGVGGPTTVRGYERDLVELLDVLGIFGARTEVLVLNEELRFPIWGALRGVAFLDYGRAWARINGATAVEYRLGAGAGLRYSTPVGVLRLDVGLPLRGDQTSAQYYVGLGQAF